MCFGEEHDVSIIFHRKSGQFGVPRKNTLGVPRNELKHELNEYEGKVCYGYGTVEGKPIAMLSHVAYSNLLLKKKCALYSRSLFCILSFLSI